MENANRWYFTKELLDNTPTRKCCIEASKELSYRQQSANFIQDMGQRLQVTQLCINTAIVYMHRFYMFHSFTKLHRNHIAVAALFLAAKVEEQPRKLEHVVRVAHKCLHRGEDLDPKSEPFMSKCNDLVYHENMMLQTLGFDIAIEHPHTYVVKLLQLVKASKDLAQTSYFMATNSLHLTTMCLQYRPTLVACVCIHLACKWSDWKIEPSTEGKEWYYYVDKSVTLDELEDLTKDFLAVLEKSPNRLKRRVGPDNNKDGHITQFKAGDEVISRLETLPFDNCLDSLKKEMSPLPSTSDDALLFLDDLKDERLLDGPASGAATLEAVMVPPMQVMAVVKSSPKKQELLHTMSLASYREKRQMERLTVQKTSAAALPAATIPTERPLSSSTLHHASSRKQLGETVKPLVSSAHAPPVKVVHQERKHYTPKVTSNEHVPKRIPDKNVIFNKHAPAKEANHRLRRSMVDDLDDLSSLLSADPHPTSKHSSSDASKPSDPFVLLTRVDQQQQQLPSLPLLPPLPSLSAPLQLPPPPTADRKDNATSKGVAHFKTELETSLSTKKPVLPPTPPLLHQPLADDLASARHSKQKCDNETSLAKLLESRTPKNRNYHHHNQQQQQQHMVVTAPPLPVDLLPNNHLDLHQPLTQDQRSTLQPTTTLGIINAKANGSKVPELPVVDHRRLTNAVLPPQEHSPAVHPDKHLASHKQERREKHRHKHTVHSNKERASSNHVAHHSPSVELQHPPQYSGGLKITIPKDKLILSVPAKAETVPMKTTSLKIKLPKPPPPLPSPAPTGIKLVITKDKNAGSYSASHKADRSSRKRGYTSPPEVKERPSKSSRGHNAKTPKVHHRLDQQSAHHHSRSPHLDGVAELNNIRSKNSLKSASVPDPMLHHHHHQKATNFQQDLRYHQNSVPHQQQHQYVMPYGAPQQYYQYYQHPYNVAQPVHYVQAPMVPHSDSTPPLPRDPPPPLPPQPPLPSE